jgi:transposase
LARWTRSDPELLAPVRHRGAQAQADRAFLSARDVAVASRAQLINCVRSLVKSQGSRLPSCSAAAFARKVAGGIPSCLGPALTPLLEQISSLTRVIRHYDGQIEAVSEERYPVTAHLRRIRGVGPITALAYVLAIEDPHRFTRSRKVGAYVGLVPRKEQSGDRDPQLHITKAGDRLLRRLLLQCAHYILGPFGEDCDLRRWAQAKIEHGGRASRKRALVAVARKLAVKMHRLWVTGEIYDPLRLAHARGEAAV